MVIDELPANISTVLFPNAKGSVLYDIFCLSEQLDLH